MQGVLVQLAGEGFLTLKVPDAGTAATVVATINGRAATRSALRQKARAAAVGSEGGGSC